MKKKLPRSIRKYIRGEKARIRRDFFGVEEQERLIRELRERFLPKIKKTESEKPLREKEDLREKKSREAVKKSASHQLEKSAGTKKKLKSTPRTPKKSKSVSPGPPKTKRP